MSALRALRLFGNASEQSDEPNHAQHGCPHAPMAVPSEFREQAAPATHTEEAKSTIAPESICMANLPWLESVILFRVCI